WVLLIRQARVAGAGMAMASPTMGLNAPLFLMTWVVMMVAMMLPAASPMILTFHRVQETRRRRQEAFVSTWIFVGGYLLVWTVAGVAAYAGALAAESIGARLALPASAVARIGGAILVAAGLYQLSPLKDRCLTACRSPLSFIMTSWREGAGGAVRMGLAHGMQCLGCCWLLFIILFPLGIMNIAAMIAVTLLVSAEKVLPWGGRAVRATAAALVLYGVAVALYPSALPTFTGSGGMVSPAPGMMARPGPG
ncbi:MAG: DUF2182 domain-containing protein, partial [Acetobacteraceae bacterium]